MNIQKISSLGVKPALNNLNNQSNPFKTAPMKADTFEFTGKAVKLSQKEILKELQEIKDEKGKTKFRPKEAQFISNVIAKTPDKYEPLTYLANKPQVRGKDLYKMSTHNTDALNMLKELSDYKKEDDTPKFSGSQLVKLGKVGKENIEGVKALATTSLDVENIRDISLEKGLDYKKAAKKIIHLEKVCGTELNKISFSKDLYDPENSYIIKAEMKDDSTKTELVDKKLNRLFIDAMKFYKTEKNVYQIKKSNDLRNNTISKVRAEIDKNGYPLITHEIRIVKDKNGKAQRIEYMTPSEVKGVYDVKHVFADGTEKTLCSGTVDKKTGITSVKKDIVSLDGTKTHYLYEDDPQGNRIIDYVITDKNGKKLLNYSQTFEKINDNKFISSKNEKSYEITFDDKTLNITDRDTKESNKIVLNHLLQGDRKSMINLLKKVPGEELIALKDTTKTLMGAKKLDDCYLDTGSKTISIVDDLYSLLHELGHAKDFSSYDHVLTEKKDVQKVYNEEREAFNKAFPNTQREHINYFIDIKEHYSGPLGGVEETVAESNALLNSYNSQMDIASRSQYLQQYFPKTIACLAQHLYNKF